MLLLARADADPGEWAALAGSHASNMAEQRSELILLHDEAIAQGAAALGETIVAGLRAAGGAGRKLLAAVIGDTGIEGRIAAKKSQGDPFGPLI